MDRATSDAILLPAPGFDVDYLDLVGKPFRLGGRGPDAFDCYGLVEELERRAGRDIPPLISPNTTQGMAALLSNQVNRWEPCQLGPGAVLTFRIGGYVTHVGVVLNGFQFIHCTGTGNAGVMVERIALWERRIVNCIRYVK